MKNYTKHYKPHHLPIVFGLVLFLVGVINYAILVYSQKQIIEHEAIRIAEVVSNQALSSRSVYSAVVSKLTNDGYGGIVDFHEHKGYVPIPAQFLKYLGYESRQRDNDLYSYKPISKWNLNSAQGIQDDFEHFAWEQLEHQDSPNPTQPIDWKPVYRFEKVNGINSFRYIRADPAAKSNCIECHNKLEKAPETMIRRLADHVMLGKQWKLNQLMGAIEVNIPVDKVELLASHQSTSTLIIVLLISLSGFAYPTWLATRNALQEQSVAQHFEHKSKRDPLTQLGNRDFVEERGQKALSQAEHNDTRLGILFIDLDKFKPINDTYGHATGDLILQEIAKRLTGSLRSTDTVARLGGDEFLVLLEGGSVYNVLVIAQKLVDVLRLPVTIDGQTIPISASIGISRYPEHGNNLKELIEKADAAMYQVKKEGKGGYFIWTENTQPRSKQD